MIISDLFQLNILREKCSILDRFTEDYDYYFINGLEWLLENQEKINKDFNALFLKKSIDFAVLMQSHHLKATEYYFKSLEKLQYDFNLFSKCMNYLPFDILNEKEQRRITKLWESYKKIDNALEKSRFFEENKRR